MKKISSGTLNQKLKRETTKATRRREEQDQHDRRACVTIIEFQKCSGICRLRPGVAGSSSRLSVCGDRDVAVLRRVRVRPERREDRPADRREPEQRGDDQEGVQQRPAAGVSALRGERRRACGRRLAAARHAVLLLEAVPDEDDDRDDRDHEQDHRDRRAVADAARLADDVVGHEHRQQLEAVAPVVDDVDDVEGAQRLDHRDDDDHDVDRPQRREDDGAERLPLAGAVDRRRLAQRRVDRLQPGEVQHHDVAGVPPADGDQDGPQVQLRVARASRSRGRAPGPRRCC